MPVRITAKHTTVSDSTKQHIEKVCAKLDQYCDRIVDCEVVLERRARHGTAVEIIVKVPGSGAERSWPTKLSAFNPAQVTNAARLSTSGRLPCAILVKVDALTCASSATCFQVQRRDLRSASSAA